MTALQTAMETVDSNIDALSEVRARVSRTAPADITVLFSDAASERSAKVSARRAQALTAASLAKEAGGQDPRAWTPAQATMVWGIAEALIAIMDERPQKLDEAFRQGSSPTDLARARATEKAASGEDSQ